MRIDGQELVGLKWYKDFMERNKDKLKRGRAKVKDFNCQTWFTIAHFEAMYDSVYEYMVEAGVAQRLSEWLWFDRDSNKTHRKELAFGVESQYELIRPECCPFVDETGSNTNQKDDDNVGGQMFVVPVDGCNVGIKGAVTDMHFTVLCFTAATGEPVLCAVIFK
jgi:hypothetical protein